MTPILKKFRTNIIILLILAILTPIGVVQGLTAEELQAKINALLWQISQLQQQLAQLKGQPTQWCYDFNVNLKIGMAGSEVAALHIALEKEGFTINSEEKNNQKFEESTASAVSGFQQKYKDEILIPLGLQYGTGYVGAATRAKLNKLYGCSGTRVTPFCIQVITPAKNPNTGECKNFPTPCDVPFGWIKVESCKTTAIPSITIISPNGGEVFKIGETITVKWQANNMPSSAIIDVIRLRNYETRREYNLVSNTINDGSETLTIPESIPEGAYTLEIKTYFNNTIVFDSSDSYFKIVSTTPPSITVISPQSGEKWEIGKTYTIRWTIQNISPDVKVRLSLVSVDSSYVMELGSDNAASIGFVWQIPFSLSEGKYKIKIYCDSPKITCFGESEPLFIVAAQPPSITVLSPNGGEMLKENSSYTIKWNAYNLPNDAKIGITLWRNDGANMDIVSGLPASQREYLWKVTSQGNWGYPCFAKGTKVLMKNGSLKNIEEIKTGESVISYDFKEKKFSVSKVVEVLHRQDPIVMINQKLKVAPDQLIYTITGFKQAKNLQIGDLLFTYQGKLEKVFSISQELEKVETFDLILEGNQNFFAEGYLVHSAPNEKELKNNSNSSIFRKLSNILTKILGIKEAKAVNDYFYQIMVSASWGTFGTPYYGSVSDSSDGWFEIINPFQPITVLSPNGGEVFIQGNNNVIQWSGVDLSQAYIYLTDIYNNKIGCIYNGVNFNAHGDKMYWTGTSVSPDCAFIYHTSISPGYYKVLIVSTDGRQDYSDAPFSIVKP